MESASVNPNDTALASQYDSLRRDARGGANLSPHQQSSPNMTIYIEAGVVYIGSTQVVYAGGNSPSMVAPVSNPRIDVVYINSSGTIVITTGSEGASPSAPAYPTDGSLVICEIYHRTAEVSIKTTDDTVNGYISKDAREFLMVGTPFKSRVRVRSTVAQSVNGSSITAPVDFDTEDFDDNSEFDNFQISSTTTSATTNKLIDSGANFTASYVGRFVYNQSTHKYARVATVDSTTQLGLSDTGEGANIFPSGTANYTIFGSRYTVKVAGYYNVNAKIRFTSATDQVYAAVSFYKNGSQVTSSRVFQYASGANPPFPAIDDIVKLSVGDYIEFFAENNQGGAAVMGSSDVAASIILLTI